MVLLAYQSDLSSGVGRFGVPIIELPALGSGLLFSPAAQIKADLVAAGLSDFTNVYVVWYPTVTGLRFLQNAPNFQDAIPKTQAAVVNFFDEGAVADSYFLNFSTQRLPSHQFGLFNFIEPYPTSPNIEPAGSFPLLVSPQQQGIPTGDSMSLYLQQVSPGLAPIYCTYSYQQISIFEDSAYSRVPVQSFQD